MYYCFKDKETSPVSLSEIDGSQLVAGCIGLEELKSCYQDFGFAEATVQHCMAEAENFGVGLEQYDGYTFGFVSILNFYDIDAAEKRMAFYIRENLFLLVNCYDVSDEVTRIFENSVQRCKRLPTLEKIIYGVLDNLIVNGNKILDAQESKIMQLEDELILKKEHKNLNEYIFIIKKELIVQNHFYEQLIYIGEELEENENNIFKLEHLRYFKIFSNKALRLSKYNEVLSENLVHLREAYEAYLEYSLNNTMKVYGAVTIICLPLSLIATWYGMNFTNMPELQYRYGYLAIILVSLLMMILLIYLLKKKNLF
ncbi:MAG: hypothetical protein LBQ96_09325 [Fusobacteriaceae bacterium]|jgi:magnesium transporter|nr:hypothetical protein [Fusobacteriaceae bacterium]